MNDLNLYAKNDDDLEGLLSNLKKISDDIGMQYDQNKYAKVTFKKSSLVKSKTLLGI